MTDVKIDVNNNGLTPAQFMLRVLKLSNDAHEAHEAHNESNANTNSTTTMTNYVGATFIGSGNVLFFTDFNVWKMCHFQQVRNVPKNRFDMKNVKHIIKTYVPLLRVFVI